MKVWQLNHSDIDGGAARAAFRIHQALRTASVDSSMHVNRATSGDRTVYVVRGKISSARSLVRPHLGNLANGLFKTGNPIMHSPSVLPSFWPYKLNRSDADIIHLHWVCSEMMSIKDIGRINKPVVWTVHDMWPFCGAEHYTDDGRFHEGYVRNNRPDHESGFDLNRWTWNRKRRAWRQQMHIVAPSRWLASCVSQSVLMRDWPVSVIPYALDTDVWRPVGKSTSRQIMGLPEDRRLLAFGALREGSDPRKGINLLLATLENLRGGMSGLELVIFGQRQPREKPDVSFPIHYAGHLHDDLSLRVLYSAVDAIIVPSRQDNLPNIGVEALSCGTPVIAFNTCGLPDIVKHQETGWLAEAFNTDDLARGIHWVLEDEERLATLGERARRYAEQNFAASVIAEKYRALYESVLLTA